MQKVHYQAFFTDFPGLSLHLITPIIIIPRYPFDPNIAEQILKNSDGLVFNALWDTGATHSVITPTAIARAGITNQIIKFIRVKGVNSETEKPVYIIGGLVLPNNVILEHWELTESEIGVEGIDLLIGMDIISKGDLSLSNCDNRTKFCFSMPPHHNKIDLVQRAGSVNKRKSKIIK